MATPRRMSSDTGRAQTAQAGFSGLADSAVQDIETLKRRYENLSREKTRAETTLDHARAQLDELKKRARESYGTDDLEQLKSKLAEMKEENERKRARYQQDLTNIEEDLRRIELEYRTAGAGGDEE